MLRQQVTAGSPYHESGPSAFITLKRTASPRLCRQRVLQPKLPHPGGSNGRCATGEKEDSHVGRRRQTRRN
jgi:hypothetical protein